MWPSICARSSACGPFINSRASCRGTRSVLYSTSLFPADLGLFLSGGKCEFLNREWTVNYEDTAAKHGRP